MLVPAHPVWLLDDGDVKARVEISKRFLKAIAGSLIGIETIQRGESLTKAKLRVQAIKTREIQKDMANVGAEVVMSVHAPYTPIGKYDLASISEDTRDYTMDALAKCVELAEIIGAKVVNAHLGGIIAATHRGDLRSLEIKRAAMERVGNSLVDLTSRIEGRDVVLAIENIPYPLEETPMYSPLLGIFPADFLEVLRAVGSKNLGVTIDFCHLWISHKSMKELVKSMGACGPSAKSVADDYQDLTLYEMNEIRSLADRAFDSFVERLKGEVVHVHAADSDGIYVPTKSRVSEGKALGEGDLDLESFAASLKNINACPTRFGYRMVVIEPKEADLSKPMNSLKSMLRLVDLIKKKIKG